MKTHYDINIVYVFVNKTELKKRIITRYIEGNANRLPDFINIDTIYEKIYKSFISHIKKPLDNIKLHLIDTNDLKNLKLYENITNLNLEKITGFSNTNGENNFVAMD